jgi:hypothetical protein
MKSLYFQIQAMIRGRNSLSCCTRRIVPAYSITFLSGPLLPRKTSFLDELIAAKRQANWKQTTTQFVIVIS